MEVVNLYRYVTLVVKQSQHDVKLALDRLSEHRICWYWTLRIDSEFLSFLDCRTKLFNLLST